MASECLSDSDEKQILLNGKHDKEKEGGSSKHHSGGGGGHGGGEEVSTAEG